MFQSCRTLTSSSCNYCDISPKMANEIQGTNAWKMITFLNHLFFGKLSTCESFSALKVLDVSLWMCFIEVSHYSLGAFLKIGFSYTHQRSMIISSIIGRCILDALIHVKRKLQCPFLFWNPLFIEWREYLSNCCLLHLTDYFCIWYYSL